MEVATDSDGRVDQDVELIEEPTDGVDEEEVLVDLPSDAIDSPQDPGSEILDEPDIEIGDTPSEAVDSPDDLDADAPGDTPLDESGDSPLEMDPDVSEIEVDLGPQYSLTLSVGGTGAGTIVSVPLEIGCGTDASDCSAGVTPETEVTLSAQTLGGSGVTDWDIVLCHGLSECTFVMEEDRHLEIVIDITDNLIFITSHVTEGGLTAASARCNEAAETAGLPGTYVAWLSTNDAPPSSWASILVSVARGWVRYDGLPVADTVEDLQNGEVFYPVLFSEDGTELDVDVATGSNSGGIATGVDCEGWESTTGTASGGFSSATTDYWTQGNELSCGTVYIYCMGVDIDIHEVGPEPATGLNAFLSPVFEPQLTEGVAAADAHCNTNAGDLPGTYRALLPTKPTDLEYLTALEHLFDIPSGSSIPWPDQVWVRPDGVPIVENPEDLAMGPFVAPLNVTSAGEYSSEDVWTGSSNGFLFLPAGDFLGATCANWNSDLVGFHAVVGISSFVSARMYNDSFPTCVEQRALYCLQVPE